jgi:hypothetical protein
MAWVLVFHVKESAYFHEENTIAPHHVEEEATVKGYITQDQLERELYREKIAAGKSPSEDNSVSVPEKSIDEVTLPAKLVTYQGVA